MKKINSLIIVAILAVILIAGCKKEPSEFTITCDKDTVRVNEPVTFTIHDLENYKKILWFAIHDDSPDDMYGPDESNSFFTTRANGGESDLTWTVEFLKTGNVEICPQADNTATFQNTKWKIVRLDIMVY